MYDDDDDEQAGDIQSAAPVRTRLVVYPLADPGTYPRAATGPTFSRTLVPSEDLRGVRVTVPSHSNPNHSNPIQLGQKMSYSGALRRRNAKVSLRMRQKETSMLSGQKLAANGTERVVGLPWNAQTRTAVVEPAFKAHRVEIDQIQSVGTWKKIR